MDKIKKILAPTDLSELSQSGVRHALNLAKTLGAEVTVYHVVTHGELIQYNKEMGEGSSEATLRPDHNPLETYHRALTRFLKNRFPDLTSQVKIHERVDLGVPHKNIVQLAEEEGSDLIVISTHGRTGLLHMLVGSVTERVIRHAPCPVLSIRPEGKEKLQERSAAVG